MTFDDFGFDENIRKGIREAGFSEPMPVQEECFELLIGQGRDIYAQSQTGTGKTAAFLLGIFQLLVSDDRYKGHKALVIVPTRELAVQIEREGKLLGKYLKDTGILSVFGGTGYESQKSGLKKNPSIIIGTPGRILDFSKQRIIDLKQFTFLVIDEADRLFDMGFLPDLRKILKFLPPPSERKTMLFSATLNSRVGNLAWEYMNDPGEVIIEPEKITVDTVSQELYHVGKDEKMKLLLGLIKRDDPENSVIFTNTRHSTWEVAKRLEVNGYDVSFLMGDLPQSKRLKIVDEVKKGHHKYLVATDVAARGLHIDGLEMVVNYDVPLDAESYVHRIGRTARAGRKGRTVTLACEEYVYGLGPIEKLLGRKIPVSWADENLVIEDKSAGMSFPPQQRYREMDRENRGYSREKSYPSRDKSRQGTSGNRNKKPSGQTKPQDKRLAKIQSAVSNIAGSDENLSGSSPPPGTRKNHKKSASSPVSKNSGKATNTIQKTVSPASSPRTHKKNPASPVSPASSKSSGSRTNSPTSPGTSKKAITSSSTMEERLAYYREKYGEDFSTDKKSASRSDKTKTKPSRKPKNTNRTRPNTSPPHNSKRTVTTNSEKVRSPDSSKTGRNRDETKKGKTKKSLFSRLLGKSPGNKSK